MRLGRRRRGRLGRMLRRREKMVESVLLAMLTILYPTIGGAGSPTPATHARGAA